MEVACAHCSDYGASTITRALEKLLALPTIAAVIPAQGRVLLKVNCLNPHPPERGVTTHPAVVTALCRLLVLRGLEVWVGDSAGGVTGKTHTAHALEVTGLAEAARQAGARVVNFDAHRAVAVTNPRAGGPDPLYLAAPLGQVDMTINLPKLKTHLFTGLTAAVKNCYGCLPGAYKHQLHRDYPGLDQFSQVLVDVCLAVAPALSLLDAVWSMEGNGPAMGTLVRTGVLLASPDPFSLDVAACRLAQWPLEAVSTNRAARERGLLPGPQQVAITGDPLPVVPRPLKRPLSASFTSRVPGWLLQAGFAWLQPTVVVDRERCTGCQFCQTACPAGALEQHEDQARVRREDCIACYCCVELCPQQAMDLRRRYQVRWSERWQ